MEEENEFLSKRALKLGFKPQKENEYNVLLAFSNEIDSEGVEELKLIKTNLVKSLSARELKPGFYLWTLRFEQFLKLYGLMFSKDDHIRFIKMYLEVIKIEKQESMCLVKWCDILCHLLKKRFCLSRDELEIEWRPLYEFYLRTKQTNKTRIGFTKNQLLSDIQVQNVIKHSRIYFRADATQEILDECKPKMCPFYDSDITECFEILKLFLPTCVKAEEVAISYDLWFDEFMTFWESCVDDNYWENSMMFLLSRLCVNNIGHIDFTPYFPLMYARFTRSFQLPVHYKTRISSKTHTIDIRPISSWIVSTLKSELSFEHLEKFLRMIRSFLYSANVGRWTVMLIEFMNKLSKYFADRIYRERYRRPIWERDTPKEFELSDADIDRFVLALKPCLELAMFSRMTDIAQSFQNLSSIRPNLIVPMVLEKLYASLDSLTEPHKLISAMNAVTAVSVHMATGAKNNYPEGPTHIIPLLMAVLPGIDPNDSNKCFRTFHFITQFVSLIPIVNSSEAGNYHELTEEEQMICEASAGFEDFVVQFFDKICAWVESCSLDFVRPEQQNGGESNTRGNLFEFISEHAMSAVINVILRQCSPEIFTSALKKIFNFVTTNVLEIDVAGRLTGLLCGSFTKVNPKETMKLFVPYLCDKIESLLDDENSHKEEHLDGEILYNLLILSEIIDGRSEVNNYLDKLVKILDLTLHLTCVDATKISVHLFTNILSTLTLIQPIDCRSSDKCFSTPLKEFLPVREWGYSLRTHKLKVKWYTPGENEMKTVDFLVKRYLIPELNKLNDYCTGENVNLSRIQLRNSLRIINGTLVLHSILPMWNDEPSIELIETVAKLPTFRMAETKKFSVNMPDGTNVRKAIADTLHKVQKKLLETDEGDTKSMNVISNIFYIILTNKMPYMILDTNWNFIITKKINENRFLDRKKHLRHILIEKCMLHQSLRFESPNYIFTSTHEQILRDLFELGVSRYRDVRVFAQSKLTTLIKHFHYSYRLFSENFVRIFRTNTETNHEMFKGGLFIFHYFLFSSNIIKQDWKFLGELWPLLVGSMPSEKPSIIDLITTISQSVSSSFQTPQLNCTMSDDFYENFRSLYENSEMAFNFTEEIKVKGSMKNEERCSENQRNYRKLLESLLAACKTRNLHWRYRLLAVGLIRDLVHPDIKYDESIIEYFLNALIDESILIRKIALKVVVSILIQQKLKYEKIEMNLSNLTGNVGDTVTYRCRPGHRNDNEWLMYKMESLPKNENDWNEMKYSHDVSQGYYAWPKNYEIYAPSDKQPHPIDDGIDKMTLEQREIVKFFTNPEKISKLIYFFSLEDKKGKDRFDVNKALIFKYLSKLMEEKILDILLPYLENLVMEKQESSQRCASEILSGLIRGSKHWSYEKSEKLWSKAIPLIQKANQNILIETIPDWSKSLCVALNSRDSRKYHWLIEFLMDDPLSDPTSLIAGVKIYLLSNAIYQQPWKNSELYHRFYEYLKKHMTHSFQLIRTKISTSLKVIFMRDYLPPNGVANKNPKIHDFFREYIPELEWLYNDTLKKIDADQGRNDDPDDVRRDETMRLYKIVCKFITTTLVCRLNLYTPLEFYEILPLTCVLQSNDVDEEIQPMSLNLLALLARNIVVESKMSDLLVMLENVVSCPLWSARSALAEFLSTFVFHNMSILSSRREWVERIRHFALVLLEDPQPEVREQACKFLSGLLHCDFLFDPLELLHDFKLKARTKLKKKTSASVNNLIIRHSGVLGLCAFISSTPYDVPEYLPDIFGILGLHLNDPPPIPSTIRKTLGEFKRTHQDNWEVHKMQFSEEQMLVFRDLTVPPSYYV